MLSQTNIKRSALSIFFNNRYNVLTWKAEAFLAETVAALKVVALEAGFMATLRAATTGAETIAEAIATILYVLFVFVFDADQAQVQSMY